MQSSYKKYEWARTKWDFSRDDIVLTEEEAIKINESQLNEPLRSYHLLWCLGDDELTLKEIQAVHI
jgi:hypothetical protein